VPSEWECMSTRGFFGGVLIGLAIDLPPFFLVNDNAEFELSTLLLLLGVLAVSGVALYVALSARIWMRQPRKGIAASKRVKAGLWPTKQRSATNEADRRSSVSHTDS
jgi:uncharacterized membrane protein YciS (DUF1049 family)